MKTITLTYTVPKTITVNVKELPWKYKKWLEIWFMEEEDRTDEQWDFFDNGPGFHGIIEEVTGDIVDPYNDIEIEDYEE